MAKPFPGLLSLVIVCADSVWTEAPARAQAAASVAEIPVSSAQVRRALAQAIGAEDRAAVAANSWLLARMGGALSDGTRARIAPLFPDGSASLPGELDTLFDANAVPIAASSLVDSIPVEHRLVEGVAFDPVRRRLFAGSVVDRRLLVRGPEGWAPVPIDNLGGVFGMAIDLERRLVWLATGWAEPVPEGRAVFAGLVAIDLDRLTERRRIAMPGVQPGDVAIGRDGSLFVSDGQAGTIHVCRPGCSAAQILVAPGRLRSPQGMVPWSDDRHLIVADYSHGLFRIDIASGAVEPILPAAPAMLEGMDGLLLHRGRLLAIQNGSLPRRILALSLDREASAISSIEVLERAHPEWGEPTLGTMDGDRLLYVADAQWERFGAGGALQGEDALRPTAIRALPIPSSDPD